MMRSESATRSGRIRRNLWGACVLAVTAMVVAGCTSGNPPSVESLTGLSVSIASSAGSSSTASESATSASETAGSTDETAPSVTVDASAAVSTTSAPAQTTTASPTASAPATTKTTAPTTTKSTTTQTTTSTTAAPPPVDPTTTFTGNPGNLAVTAPGTKLTYGQPATVPFSDGISDGVFTLTNLTVTKGSASDWAALGADADTVAGQTPWYLKVTVKQESGGDFAESTDFGVILGAYTGPDDYATEADISNETNAICPFSDGPGTNFKVGDSYTSCTVFAVDDGTTVQRVQFEGSFTDGDKYFDSPVVWTTG